MEVIQPSEIKDILKAAGDADEGSQPEDEVREKAHASGASVHHDLGQLRAPLHSTVVYALGDECQETRNESDFSTKY